MEEKLKEFIDVLREKGHKVTPQRLEIYRIIKNSKHPTAEEIYRKVKKSHPTVSPATVYKTIELLRGMGEIQEISVIDGKIRYETNMNPHINLHCLGCGKVEDLFLDKIKELGEEVALKSRYEIKSQSFDFFGYCSKCQKQNFSKNKNKREER
ncbi:MAG: Fur family transcriptional regulator [Candidatus Freyarchaeota archaeon]|nr:Fur family transcriptional regulator [Candidatus Freyarchaeota archaeon]